MQAWFARSNGETVHSDPDSRFYVPGSPAEIVFDYRETCLREGFARVGMPASGDLRSIDWGDKYHQAYETLTSESDERVLREFRTVEVGDVIVIPANLGRGAVHIGVVLPASPPNADPRNAYYYHFDTSRGDWFENAHRVNVRWARDVNGDPAVLEVEGLPWRQKFARLHAAHDAVAAAAEDAGLLAAIAESSSIEVFPLEPVDEADAFPEGREAYALHRTRERNPEIVRRKKSLVFAQNHVLGCEVCGFDFDETYGAVGTGYIECHHAVPISEYADGDTTTVDDLHLVCANCHRMLHRSRPWMTVAELRARLTAGS